MGVKKTQDEIEDLNALQSVLSTQDGRHLLWNILSYCGVYQDISSEQSNLTHRGLGRREVGLYILQTISDYDDDLLFKMMKEASLRNKERELRHERSKRESERSDNRDRDILSGISDDEYGDDESILSGHDSGGPII